MNVFPLMAFVVIFVVVGLCIPTADERERKRRRVLPVIVASPGYYPDDDVVTYESVARALRPEVRRDIELASRLVP